MNEQVGAEENDAEADRKASEERHQWHASVVPDVKCAQPEAEDETAQRDEGNYQVGDAGGVDRAYKSCPYCREMSADRESDSGYTYCILSP